MDGVILLRSASAPIRSSPVLCSPKAAFSDQDSGTGVFFFGTNGACSPRSALHFENKKKRFVPTTHRRALSESDLFRSETGSFSSLRSLSRRFSTVTEEDDLLKECSDLERESHETLDLKRGTLSLISKGLDLGISDQVAGICTGSEVFTEEVEFSDGGVGNGRKVGGGKGGGSGGNESFTGGGADQNRIEAYYQEMLKANPGDPLLLRNYGKFLHEVEKDLVRAEEYYGRAILANPGDGEVLSLYGKVIWEAERDSERAEGYFDQAIKASPDDCYVLGSYANFLWDAEEAEEEEEKLLGSKPSTLVKEF
ncbi:uncharacterized protein LOC143877092 [Tasmannia lanceolata]|uniref:uncharacterized protein LOC143877092 n=1 Tax=Tasmannia lanceolata TaxID=3420 RepID=UPI0040630F1A